MSELKRTQLYDAHVAAGATLVDFGGWEMPIQYPTGIVAEHLYCRSDCGIFDVSHMGRLDIEGPENVKFLQHVLSSNVLALDVNQSQYAPESPTRRAASSTTCTSTALRRANTCWSSTPATSTRTWPTCTRRRTLR